MRAGRVVRLVWREAGADMAVLRARGEHAAVEDLNSANGTRLNGKRLKPFCPAAV